MEEQLSSHPVSGGVGAARSLVVCIVFCRSLFVLSLLAIVFSVPRFTASVDAFGTFRPFLTYCFHNLNEVHFLCVFSLILHNLIYYRILVTFLPVHYHPKFHHVIHVTKETTPGNIFDIATS